MQKLFLILLMIVPGVSKVCAQDQLVVDANAQPRALTGSFSKIKISDGLDIYMSQASTEALAVSASDSKYADRINTTISGTTLIISYDKSGGWSSGNKKLKVYIAFTDIDELEASGSSDIFVAGAIDAPKLRLKLSGASDFTGSVNAENLLMELSGSSDVKINGTATEVKIENSGASDVKGYGLIVDICSTKSSGASDVNITVNKELNVDASGASDVYYKGTAVLKTSRSSGSSTIAKSDR